MAGSWGRTLVIANPVAQSGRGEAGARAVKEALEAGMAPVTSYVVRLTEDRGHATQLAAQATAYDTVLVLGGDGVVHETVNGLMQLDAQERPRLGVLPLGSGNDFARTAGIAARNRPQRALRELAQGREHCFGLGFVASNAKPDGAWFMQTLSFGLDAAVALGSMESRKRSGAHGTRLFGTVGLDIFARNREPYPYCATLWDAAGARAELAGAEIVFAVQVGPTYGGGFRICPDASPTDGLLDLCRSVRVPSVPRTLALFVRARGGLHVGSSVVELRRFERMELRFCDREPPCQIDGEELRGRGFSIRSVPAAVRVLCGAKRGASAV